MIDNHVHIGWYIDGYHSPKEVWQAELEAGINEIVVSSTSTCAELYKLVVKEMRELIHLGGKHVHPILWLTPRMFHSNCQWALSYLLHSKIRWQGIKLHWQAHREWFYNRKILHNALEVARWMNVPVLLHTGNYPECHAGVFQEVISNYNDVNFVLAHGRPLEETVEVLSNCTNSYVDTSFMPIEDVVSLIDRGFSDRVMFGTDAPINRMFYKDISTTEYIQNSISLLKKGLPSEAFNVISESSIYQ